MRDLDVMHVLGPIRREKPEVARKVYPANRRVLDRAVLRHRHGVELARNPADWIDLKSAGIAKPVEPTRGPSLPYAEMLAFIAALRERDAVAARAF